jgi:hypothetical protein
MKHEQEQRPEKKHREQAVAAPQLEQKIFPETQARFALRDSSLSVRQKFPESAIEAGPRLSLDFVEGQATLFEDERATTKSKRARNVMRSHDDNTAVLNLVAKKFFQQIDTAAVQNAIRFIEQQQVRAGEAAISRVKLGNAFHWKDCRRIPRRARAAQLLAEPSQSSANHIDLRTAREKN